MSKVYVAVVAEFSPEGALRPTSLTWKDGRRYDIDKVLECRKAVSLKAGGQGMRYTCMVKGRQVFLFQEENRWFMEGRDGEA